MNANERSYVTNDDLIDLGLVTHKLEVASQFRPITYQRTNGILAGVTGATCILKGAYNYC